MLISDDFTVFWGTIENYFFVFKLFFSYKKTLLDVHIECVSKKIYISYEITLKFGKILIEATKIGIFMRDNFFWENLKTYKRVFF